jgi:hypothetical protein
VDAGWLQVETRPVVVWTFHNRNSLPLVGQKHLKIGMRYWPVSGDMAWGTSDGSLERALMPIPLVFGLCGLLMLGLTYLAAYKIKARSFRLRIMATKWISISVEIDSLPDDQTAPPAVSPPDQP